MATMTRPDVEPGEARRLDRATADLDPPFAVVDLDALDANADDLVRRAAGKPIRGASKSVRSRGGARARVAGWPARGCAPAVCCGGCWPGRASPGSSRTRWARRGGWPMATT